MKMSEIAWSNQERHGTFGRLFLLLRDFELDDAPKGLLNCLFYMFTRHCHWSRQGQSICQLLGQKLVICLSRPKLNKYELQLRLTLSLQADERKALKEQVGIWVTHIQVIQLGKKWKSLSRQIE